MEGETTDVESRHLRGKVARIQGDLESREESGTPSPGNLTLSSPDPPSVVRARPSFSCRGIESGPEWRGGGFDLYRR